VRLEAVRCGGHWVTSKEALSRFFARLTPIFNDTPAPAPRTPGQRDRSAKRVGKRLEQIGIR
jgi:hypothetical protein